MSKILIVEDDPHYVNDLRDSLDEFASDIAVISTEAAFRAAYEAIASNPPELIVMDIMLRWTDPSEQMSSPSNKSDSFHRAGLRCLKMLRDDPRTQNVQVILYSVLEESDVARDMRAMGLTARHVVKSMHTDIVKQIKNILGIREL